MCGAFLNARAAGAHLDSASMARTHLSRAVPLREELEALAHAYHLLEAEIGRLDADDPEPRELDEELLRIHKRFERVLEESLRDDGLGDRWHAHLHLRAAVPPEPPPADPVVFRGESDAGSVVEVRRHGDALDVRVDGEPAEGLADPDELRTRRPGLTLRVGDTEFHETFEASAPAIHELAEYAETRRKPPWQHATELLEDGLVDPEWEITPRGRRAIPTPV
jgi:hypothetical protein